MAEWRNYYRLTYSKRGSAVFIGHRDVLRLFTRALARARLPVRFTGGFSPKPKLSFPLAAKLGIAVLAEPFMLELEDCFDPEEIMDAFNKVLCTGVRIESVTHAIGKKLPAVSCHYSASVGGEIVPDEIIRKIHDVALVEKHSKKGPVEAPVGEYLRRVEFGGNGRIKIEIAVRDGKTLDPALILDAAGIKYSELTRTRVELERPRKN